MFLYWLALKAMEEDTFGTFQVTAVLTQWQQETSVLQGN